MFNDKLRKNIKRDNEQVEVNTDLCYNKFDDFRKILNQCNILEMGQMHFVDYIINQIIDSLDDPYASYDTANEMKIVSEESL